MFQETIKMEQATNPPHVLIFPFPAQGHVNSMLKLAELLALSGVHITFLVTPDIHDRLLRHSTVISRFSKYPGFYLEVLPVEIDQDHPDVCVVVAKMSDSLQSVGKSYLRELLAPSGAQKVGCSKPPITSIIADGILSFSLDVAQEIGLPFIYFRTIGACAFWNYFCIPQLIEAGELPFPGDDLDVKIQNLKGMEDFLRRRDLSSFCRGRDLTNPIFNMILSETLQTPRAQGLILNTFEHLEEPILSLIRTHCPNIYTIGPLHAHLKTRLLATKSTSTSSSNSLWEEDRNCIHWLDKQPPKSVLYVSFGSVTTVTKEELLEFWHGLVNSGTRFLWVMRPDLVIGKNGESSKTREELDLQEATGKRGYIVGWAPQEAVLAHQAVGGFLTHSGWNSTLESMIEGVPMICWPYFADQQINSRFVGEVWKLGLDMKDTCNRDIIEKLVRDLMVVRKDEFLQRAEEMAKFANKATSDGGSSSCNLKRLVEDIRRTSMPSLCTKKQNQARLL